MERRTPDAAVAAAMNRVLTAEGEASAAIAVAQREAEAIIEAARARRRRILDSARHRASQLHARAQQRLQQALAELGARESAADGPDPATLRQLSKQAIANLARRLTSARHEPD
jgi:hypothetical protein